jgi:hypothetical protein
MKKNTVFGVLAFVALGIIVGHQAGAMAGKMHSPGSISTSHSQSRIFAPDTVADLVFESEIVITGTVESYSNLGRFHGFDTGGGLIPEGSYPSTEVLEPPAIDYVSFQVRIDAILKDNGQLAIGSTIPLLEHGEYFENGACNELSPPISRVGEQYLYFLSKQPDNVHYGIPFGEFGRLDLTGQYVLETGCESHSILFGSSDPGEFLVEVQSHLP